MPLTARVEASKLKPEGSAAGAKEYDKGAVPPDAAGSTEPVTSTPTVYSPYPDGASS